ncbi:MAG TPA: ABC transporter ATP-binding protein [Armatimonadaceae bacterium]|nr:ABC transporter ATP-binding protein [Armatimonadaceae bacterium]
MSSPDSSPPVTATVAAAPAVASVRELTVRYGARTVLPGLTLDIPEGCVGLLGPNGAGKTTLLKTLMGFLKPAAGEAHVLGMNVATDPLRIRQRIGLMPEQECHIPGMSAVQFVAYAGELTGMPPAQALRRAHEVLEYTGLGEARYREVETYSTGMKQRIKLAQALVHGPKLLFLDEPTNGLDPQGRDEMLDLVRDVSHGKGLSVIVSSHLLPDIERTCDSVVVVRSGQVVRQGLLTDLARTMNAEYEVDLLLYSPAFVEAVSGSGARLVASEGSRLRFSLGPEQARTAGAAGRLFFEAARQSGAQVRGFRPALRRLEDVFMEAIES